MKKGDVYKKIEKLADTERITKIKDQIKYLKNSLKGESIENQAKYLNKILRKESLLKPDTRKAIYESLGENYKELARIKNWSGHLIKSAESFEKAGLSDKAVNTWRKIIQTYMISSDIPNNDVVLHASDSLRKLGRKKEAKAIEKKLGKKLEIYGVSNKSSYPLELAYQTYEATGQSNEAKRVERELKGLSEKTEEVGGKGSKKKRTLEASLTAIIGIITGIFFLSPNLTGNTIASLTNQTSNIIGCGLFVIGIIGSYFWFKKK